MNPDVQASYTELLRYGMYVHEMKLDHDGILQIWVSSLPAYSYPVRITS